MRTLLLISLLLLVGCSQQSIEEKTKRKTVSNRNVVADVVVEYDPYIIPEMNKSPPVDMEIFDEKIKVPPNSKVRVTVGSERNRHQDEWFEMISNVKVSKKMTSLLVIGAFCLAGGGALLLFGSWKLASGAMVFGLCLITCGVMIDTYPWVFFIVMVVVLGGMGYLFYQLIDKHKQQTAFDHVVGQIDIVKQTAPEIAKKLITDPLAKHPAANTIKKHVRRLRD